MEQTSFPAPFLVQEPGSQPPATFPGPPDKAKLMRDAASSLGSQAVTQGSELRASEPRGHTP